MGPSGEEDDDEATARMKEALGLLRRAQRDSFEDEVLWKTKVAMRDAALREAQVIAAHSVAAARDLLVGVEPHIEEDDVISVASSEVIFRAPPRLCCCTALRGHSDEVRCASNATRCLCTVSGVHIARRATSQACGRELTPLFGVLIYCVLTGIDATDHRSRSRRLGGCRSPASYRLWRARRSSTR